MDRKIIIAEVIAKLEQNKINEFLDDFEPVHKDPRKTITFVQGFQDRNQLTRQEKIKLLGEIKKKKFNDA